jgi:hypothetical protein
VNKVIFVGPGQTPYSDKSSETHPILQKTYPRIPHELDYSRARVFSQDYYLAELELLKNCTDPLATEEINELSSYIISVLLGDTLSNPENSDALLQLLLCIALFDKARADGLVVVL